MLKRIMFFVLIAIVLSACSQQEQKDLEQQEGMIVEITENQVLVVSNPNKEDITSKTTNELIEFAQENDGAYYSFKPDEYEILDVGMHVTVYWNGDQNDSDPPQRVAEDKDIGSNEV